ncbi:MAG: MBL fold metallo-hydrolase [Clostridia bacterium]|nr:MBL fold metallo-hydrolase [Clostridia bacterium]
MIIRFLGTGAADWKGVPESFPGYRYFSSALIDGTLLIDPGPDVFASAERYGIDLSGIKFIICTHSHGDHFSRETLDRLTSAGAVFIPLKEGEFASLGSHKVLALKGNHGTCSDCVHFLIGSGCRVLYYALDGAWLLYEEVEAIKNARALVATTPASANAQGNNPTSSSGPRKPVDMIVLDATIGDVPGDYRIFEHNNLNMDREIRQTLLPYIDRFVISHMALTLHRPHNELSEAMAAEGFTTACDGMTLEI